MFSTTYVCRHCGISIEWDRKEKKYGAYFWDLHPNGWDRFSCGASRSVDNYKHWPSAFGSQP